VDSINASPDDPEQSKRFLDMARELGADKSPKAFEEAFMKVVQPKPKGARSRPSENYFSLFLGVFVFNVHRWVAPRVTGVKLHHIPQAP
jgi:hypothetical protein